jgi:hypothetical protein
MAIQTRPDISCWRRLWPETFAACRITQPIPGFSTVGNETLPLPDNSVLLQGLPLANRKRLQIPVLK